MGIYRLLLCMITSTGLPVVVILVLLNNSIAISHKVVCAAILIPSAILFFFIAIAEWKTMGGINAFAKRDEVIEKEIQNFTDNE